MTDKTKQTIKPEISLINPTVEMTEPNESIQISKGVFHIRVSEDRIHEITGEISFSWFPSIGARFKGIPRDSILHFIDIFQQDNKLDLLIDKKFVSKVLITDVKFFEDSTQGEISGISSNELIQGDATVPFSELYFSIPNLQNFYAKIGYIKDDPKKRLSSRVIFECDKYSITIDRHKKFEDVFTKLKQNGGYFLTYSGSLSSKDKKKGINLSSAKKIIEPFNIFLSFVNGSRVSLLFLTGKNETETIWKDYSKYNVDPYKSTYTWSHTSIYSKGDTSIWNNFLEIWKNPEGKSFLTSVIHWYTNANRLSGAVEGAIIMAQTAIELIYNYWIIEEKKLLHGKDSEDLKAANKIRLMLSQISSDIIKIPSYFKELKNFAESTNNVTDAPDVIVYIRNAVVHSQKEKRNALSTINTTIRFQALQISIWYIELALLKILDYKNTYINRCTGYDAPQKMPWK